MKQVLIHANVAKNSKVIYDPLTGRVDMFKAKETNDNEDKIVVNEIKKVLKKYPEENLTFVLDRNLSAPVFQAMKVINTVLLGKIKEDEEEAVEGYLTNLVNAGIDPTQIDSKNIKDVLKLVKVAMNNTWTEETSLDYILELALTTEHKITSLDRVLKEPDPKAPLSPVSKNLRELALELVNTTCAIPVMQKVVIVNDDEDEELEAQ